MEMRELKNGVKSSLLGYGCMRFPVTEDGHIDEVKAKELLLKAYDNGVTYFDTAYPYHNGESEKFVGKVMSELKRDTYTLATKLPCWLVNSEDDVKRLFEEQLEHLRTDYVDFYLLHALNADSFKKMCSFGVVEKLAKYKEEGKIKNLGFSFHDGYEAFVDIVNYWDWDFCQIQLNYIDKDTQATLKGVELCKEKNIPIVIMEPVKGGSLAKLPDEAMDILKPLRPELSAAGWALTWVGSFDQIKVILSGMTEMDQLDDNLNTFNNFKVLSDEEMKAVDKVGDILLSRAKNGCTGCRYCMPCPKGVDIPRCFSIWNNYHKYDNVKDTKNNWNNVPAEAKPDACIKCGACETKCPQKISIRDDLEELNKELKAL
ncbi:MAG: aldo/keto reductase [Lachnospiraceae bacterium]|nr:aldo/keto reductase [Lachnospiraceae bacterium]